MKSYKNVEDVDREKTEENLLSFIKS